MVDFTLPEIHKLVVIVEKDKGSKVLELAKKQGVQSGTVYFGVGTCNKSIFDYLGLSDKKKDIIVMIADSVTSTKAINHISKSLEFEKPNRGIAFVEEVVNVWGSSSCAIENIGSSEGAEYMYNAIYTIVERGLGHEVIDAAQEVGSMGGTIIHGRGSGIHERQKVFNMSIEPEKEIVLILSQAEATEQIVNSIREKLRIDEPGRGIIYVTNVKETYGIKGIDTSLSI